jgi:glucosamine-6-phosphate deaminase
MKIDIAATAGEAGRRAAAAGAELTARTLDERGEACVVMATGVSQFALLDGLVQAGGIDWTRVEAFHLDEYIGIPESHPASFRRYLKVRFADRLPQPMRAFHLIDGEGDPVAECARLKALIADRTVDVAFVGIGENGHLAFNDPPADFDTEEPFIVVELDADCRAQQLGEGWFDTLDAVPHRAISMSIRQIMKARSIVCAAPDARKAAAVRMTLEGPVTPIAPASILQLHPDCAIFLDRDSASLLEQGKE